MPPNEAQTSGTKFRLAESDYLIIYLLLAHRGARVGEDIKPEIAKEASLCSQRITSITPSVFGFF